MNEEIEAGKIKKDSFEFVVSGINLDFEGATLTYRGEAVELLSSEAVETSLTRDGYNEEAVTYTALGLEAGTTYSTAPRLILEPTSRGPPS